MIENKYTMEKFLTHIKDYWFLALFIGTLIVGWSNITGEIRYQDARITALEKRTSDIDVLIGKIASDVSYIRGKLEK